MKLKLRSFLWTKTTLFNWNKSEPLGIFAEQILSLPLTQPTQWSAFMDNQCIYFVVAGTMPRTCCTLSTLCCCCCWTSSKFLKSINTVSFDAEFIFCWDDEAMSEINKLSLYNMHSKFVLWTSKIPLSLKIRYVHQLKGVQEKLCNLFITHHISDLPHQPKLHYHFVSNKSATLLL